MKELAQQQTCGASANNPTASEGRHLISMKTENGGGTTGGSTMMVLKRQRRSRIQMLLGSLSNRRASALKSSADEREQAAQAGRSARKRVTTASATSQQMRVHDNERPLSTFDVYIAIFVESWTLDEPLEKLLARLHEDRDVVRGKVAASVSASPQRMPRAHQEREHVSRAR